MKPIQFSKFLVLALAMTIAATGCKKTPTKVTNIPGQKNPAFAGQGPQNVEPSPPISPEKTAPTTTDITGAGPGGQGPGSNLKSTTGTPLAGPEEFDKMIPDEKIFAPYSVYFDFDSAVVRSSENANVAHVADYLKDPAHVANKVRIAGNCDERGTEEYNRSLGNRRALALREALMSDGIEPNRIDTVSYGKDRPRATGHDEAAWRENRRGDFILLSPPGAPVQ